MPPGSVQGLVLTTDDIAETHAELARAFDAPTPKLDSLVRRLADEGKRINQYYRSIGK